MSDDWSDEDDFGVSAETNTGNDGNGIKKLRAAHKAAIEELKTLKAENAKLTASFRSTSLSTLLSSKGYNTKVAKLVPMDVEPTEEAVTAWLEEYADALNLTPSAPVDGGDGGSGAEQSAEEQALREIGRQQASSKSTGTNQNEQLKRLQDPSLTEEELMQMIFDAGGGPGSG